MINDTGYTFKNVSIFVKTLTTLALEEGYEIDIKPYDGHKQEFAITLSEPKSIRSSKGRYCIFKATVTYDDIIYTQEPRKMAKELFKFMSHEILRNSGGTC